MVYQVEDKKYLKAHERKLFLTPFHINSVLGSMDADEILENQKVS